MTEKTRDYVSFSEIKTWGDCSFRHWLLYVLGLREFDFSVYTDYGSIVHEACEIFLETRKMNVDQAVEKFRATWAEHEYPVIPDEFRQYPEVPLNKRNYSEISEWPINWPHYADPEIEYWIDNLTRILSHIPDWMEQEFPGWELVSAEDELNESIENSSLKFKGFIDAIIKVKNKTGKDIYWILDWKTTGARGWSKDKRQDFFTTSQVVLYKHYWSNKSGVPLKDIRCGYVLLKRDIKKEPCALFKVSAGPKTIERGLKNIRSMIKMVGEERRIKNRYACTYCEFHDTDLCKLNI